MCTFPHGKASIGALTFSILAFCFAMSASVPCLYVTVTIPDNNQFFSEGTMGFGLLTYSMDQMNSGTTKYECFPWTPTTSQYFFDAPWKTAVAFGIIGNIATGICLIAAAIMTSMTFGRTVIVGLAGLQFLAAISELLTLIAFASDICSTYDCQFAASAGLAIGASLVSMVAGIFFYKTPPGQEFIPATTTIGGSGGDAEAPGTVTVQETVNPDGTKKIVKTTVNEDGSKTVEETVEGPTAQTY